RTMAEGEAKLRMLEMRLNGFKGIEDFLIYETDPTIVPPLYFVEGDQLLSKFAMELYELNQKRVNLLVSMKPIDKRVQQVDSSIKTVRNNIFRYITDNRAAIEQQRKEIEAQNQRLVSELKTIPRTQRDLLAIERK